MKKFLRSVLMIALFFCVFELNAQKAPEVRNMQVRGANVTMIIDEYHFAYDVSDNGKHVAMQGYGDYPSYYWSEETGVIPMDKGYVFAVSDDGVVAGYFLDETVGEFGTNFAGLWTPDTREWNFIGMNPDADQYIDSEYNGAWAMTNDGSKLAIMQYNGSWDTKTYTWTEADGYTLMPHGDAAGTRPNAISADGKVLAGRAVGDEGWYACYWVDGQYYDFDKELTGEAMAVSADGNYIAGYANSRIFLYNRELDELTIFEDNDVANVYNASCVTNDGVVFGYVNNAFPPIADARRGVVAIDGELITVNDYLMMKGVDEAADWITYGLTSVTSDGNTFVGAANIDDYDYTFIMTIEEPECQAPSKLKYSIDRLNNYDDVVLTWEAPEDASSDVVYEIYEDYLSDTPLATDITETTYTFVDVEQGVYTFVVKAKNGECLSPSSNKITLTVDPCSLIDQCEIYVVANDDYADGWNGAYIEVSGEENGMSYRMELTKGLSDTLRLSLCSDVYTFKWVAGLFDEEISFSIHHNDEELYATDGKPEAGTIMKYELDCTEEIVELEPFVEVCNSFMFPYDVSDNKKHIVTQTFGEGVSYYWSEETGIVRIDGYAFAVSNSGVVAGCYLDVESLTNLAGLWNPDTKEWTPIGEIPGKTLPTDGTVDMPAEYNGAWAMTNDGSSVAVMYTNYAWQTSTYLWNEEDGYVQLQHGSSQSSRPNAISNDGRVVAGHGVANLGWTICYWVDGEFHEVPYYYGEALSVSSSGKYIGGYIDSGSAFILNTETDEIEFIYSEEFGGDYKVVCINNEGEAFGFYDASYPPSPYARTAFAYVGGQVITFNDYLKMKGYEDAEEWMFYGVSAVTKDGRTFLCSLSIDGEDYVALITIPETECEAPRNLTYTLDDEDPTAVTLNWTAPENSVDVTYEIYDDIKSEPLYSGITETTYTIRGLEPGQHKFMVRANHGECLSTPSNGVSPVLYPCVENDKCELRFILQDEYADMWNGGYIELVGTKSDIVYRVEMDYGKSEEEVVLSLCPDVYTFTWMQGAFDAESAFAIYNGEEELYSVKFKNLEDSNIGAFLEYNLDCGTGVDEIASQKTISLMPNPAKDYFNIEGVDMIDVEVYNAIGQKIDAVNVNNDNVQINIANYEAGIYLVKINTSDADVIVRKVVVTK